MTGAAAGHIGPGTPPSGPRADVVDLHTRRHGRKRGQRDLIQAAPTSVEESTRQKLAINIEALFLRRQVTLADPETIAALEASLDAVQLLLDGARAVGQLPATHWELLASQLQHLRRAPDDL